MKMDTGSKSSRESRRSGSIRKDRSNKKVPPKNRHSAKKLSDANISASAKKLKTDRETSAPEDPNIESRTMMDKAASSPVVTAAAGATEAAPVSTPKKSGAAKPKQPRAKPAHPKTAEMVVAAITTLKERGGSSLQAIKKYMASTYKVDAEKQATFIKKYLKAAVASGTLVQTKGKGAAGSFKLPSTKGESVKPKAKPTAKVAAPKKAAVAKKPAAAKKPATVAAKKAPAKKAAAKVVTEKNKASKGPAAKPPKPKTIKAKPTAKSPAKKAKPVSPKKTKPAATKAKKAAAPKKTTASKK